MTNQKIITQNKIRAILAFAFRTAALLCANGSLMQTFLSITGFSEQQIYLHATLFQAVNVLVIFLCARFADCGNPIRRAAVVQIPGALLFLFYLPLCILKNVSPISYLWLLLISFLQSVTIALHTVCEYKISYYIYLADEYGLVMSVCGILASAVSFAMGALTSFFSTRYSYDRIMLIAFCISCVFMLLVGVLQYFQKSLLPPDKVPAKEKIKEKIPLTTMFCHEAFSKLFVGNLTRGFANGTTTILAAAALSIGYDESLTSVMVSAASIANLGACALYAVTARRIHPRYMILLGSLCFVTFPMLLLQNRPFLYLVLYGVLLFGRTLVDYAVPAALLYAVPVEISGTYNAWRMILHNGGTMLATIAAGFIPLPAMLVFSMACQIVSGLNFCTARVLTGSAAHKKYGK